MTVKAAISDLQAKALALPGIVSAPESIPENSSAFPFAITYERYGELIPRASAWGDDIVTLVTEMHVSRQFLGVAINTAMELRDPFLKALIEDPTLGGAVSVVNAIRRTFGAMEYAGQKTVGYRFEIDVKVRVVAI